MGIYNILWEYTHSKGKRNNEKFPIIKVELFLYFLKMLCFLDAIVKSL